MAPQKPRTLAQLKAEKRGETVRAQHDRNYKRDPALDTLYGSARWRKVRALKVSRSPLCEVCTTEGRTTAAEQVHHIKKARTHPHLAYAMENLMSVCVPCHAKLDAGKA